MNAISRQVRRAMVRKMQKQQKSQAADQSPALETAVTNHQGWVPKGEILEFAGRRIPGMVYFGKPETFKCGYCETDHDSTVYIDPSLPVAKSIDRPYNKFPENHLYYMMHRKCRANYLDWLANGRSDPNCSIKYPYLYLLGLERRFFKDKPDEQERCEIIDEVDRLSDIYCNDDSFFEAASRFMKYASESGAYELKFEQDEADFYGLMLKTRQKWDKYEWNSKYNLPLYVSDCLPIFKDALELGLIENPNIDPYPEVWFSIQFRRKFRGGIDISEPKKLFEYTYKSISGEFVTTVPTTLNGNPYYKLDKLRKQLNKLLHFGWDILDELDGYAEFVTQFPEKADSFEAVKKLPMKLWGETGRHRKEIGEQFSGLIDWARKQVESGTTLRTQDIDLSLNRDIWKERLNCNFRGSLWVPLALCGFGVAPDFCLRYRLEKEGEPVMIYEMPTENGRIDEQRNSYFQALTEFAVGAYVLNAEKRNPEESEELLSGLISQREELTDIERNRLKANMKCVLAVPHDNGFLRRLEKNIENEWKPAVCQFLINLAHLDGMANAKTISTIEKIYAKLGMDTADAYADLHAGTASSAAKKEKRGKSKVSELDESRIESIRTDTQKVSEVLGGIFTTEDESKDAPSEKDQIQFSGLDTKHTTFLQKLLEREYWTLDEFEELARSHGLLPVGAVETINEWMFEKYEEPLLDEQDGFHLSPDIAGMLKPELDAKH